MRNRAISAGRLDDRIKVYTITSTRTASGSFVQSETLDKEIWGSVNSKMTDRETIQEGTQYFKEYEIITRAGQILESNILEIETGQRLTVIGMIDSNKLQEKLKCKGIND